MRCRPCSLTQLAIAAVHHYNIIHAQHLVVDLYLVRPEFKEMTLKDFRGEHFSRNCVILHELCYSSLIFLIVGKYLVSFSISVGFVSTLEQKFQLLLYISPFTSNFNTHMYTVMSLSQNVAMCHTTVCMLLRTLPNTLLLIWRSSATRAPQTLCPIRTCTVIPKCSS
jgi:hypothetical protein